MTEPVLTVLMPLKNHHPEFLRKAVDSILRQDDPAWRMIIVVEGEDEAPFRERLGDILRDSRVRLIVNTGRKLAGAVNTGMKAADTAFVALLLADDRWEPSAVRVLTELIQRHPDVDFFHSSRRYIDEHDEAISSVYTSRTTFTVEDFLNGSPVKHLLCWRRAKALSFGGLDETLNSVGPDDYDFPWSMAQHGAVFRAVPDCLYVYREHHSAYRLSTHLPLSVHRHEIARIMRKHGATTEQIRDKLKSATRSYLRQCIYRTAVDQKIKEWLGWKPKAPYRPTYK